MDPSNLAHQVRQAGLGFSAGICSAGIMYGALKGHPIMSMLALMTGFYIRRVARDQGLAFCPACGSPWECAEGEMDVCHKCGKALIPLRETQDNA